MHITKQKAIDVAIQTRGFILGMCMVWKSIMELFCFNASTFGVITQDRKHVAFTTALGDFCMVPFIPNDAHDSHNAQDVLVGVTYSILHPSTYRLHDMNTIVLSDSYERTLIDFKKAILLMMLFYPYIVKFPESSAHVSPTYSC
jgi:hypothetical protein